MRSSYFEQVSTTGLLHGNACIDLYLLIRSIVCKQSFVDSIGVVKNEFVVERADLAKREMS